MSEFATVDRRFWRTQLPVDYLDTSLVINTWENVSADLSGGLPVKFWWIIVEQTNNAATVETIELEITFPHPVTGVATAYTITLSGIASGAPIGVYLNPGLVGGDFTFSNSATLRTAMSAWGSNVSAPFTVANVGLMRVRQTTTVDGTSAQIEINIFWDKLAG